MGFQSKLMMMSFMHTHLSTYTLISLYARCLSECHLILSLVDIFTYPTCVPLAKSIVFVRYTLQSAPIV